MIRHIVGCGYIGKKIAGLLKAQTKDFCCYVNSEGSEQACRDNGFAVELMDLDTSGIQIKQLMAMQNAELVYLVPPPANGKIDNRISRFIKSFKNASIHPKKIILISTTGVYGNCHGAWIDETAELNPQADRAFRRVNAEQQIMEYCSEYQIENIIFRVPGIYAADKLPIKRITLGEPVVRAEDSGYTNRIHAEDLARFCIEALLKNQPSGIYNCCDGSPSTMNDYFMKVADAKGLPRPVEISLEQAQHQLSAGMLSYLAESKRISNKKLLAYFSCGLKYPDLSAGLKTVQKDVKNE